MKAVKVLFILFAAILISHEARAQADNVPVYYLGAYGGYNVNFHIADFLSLPGIPCCSPGFENSNGSGFSLGLLFDMPLFQSFDLELRAGVATLGGQLIKDEVIGNAIYINTITHDTLTSANVRHQLQSYITSFGFEPTLNFKFFSIINSIVGFRFSYLTRAKFDLSERLLSPNNVVFNNDSTVRNQVIGADIPEKNTFQLFGVFGLNTEFNAGKFILMPELRYYIPFTNLTSVEWKVQDLQLGLAVKFPIYKGKGIEYKEETIYKYDTTIVAMPGLQEEKVYLENSTTTDGIIREDKLVITQHFINEHYIKEIPKKSDITATMDILGKAADGSLQEKPSLVIEEFEAEEAFPVLSQVFFKQGSFSLGETSLKLLKAGETRSFTEDSVTKNTLDIYMDLLNVVGSRLRKYPTATIILTGCNNNTGAERNNLELSRNRAEAVKDYLVETWNIKPNRIKIKEQNLPGNPSKNSIRDGQDENSRVEITSTDFRMIEPVILKNNIRKANPPVIEISPKVVSDAGLQSYEVLITQDNQVIRKFNGEKLPEKIDWQVEENPVPILDVPIKINLSAKDVFNKKAVVEQTLQINQVTVKKKRYEMLGDNRIEKFSLILFDYDKSTITEEQKNIIKMIKERIQPDSRLTITGFTDRTGEDAYNRELAMRRCQETASLLDIPMDRVRLNPVGSDILLYDNDSPQGRSYSRTVQVVIETPVK